MEELMQVVGIENWLLMPSSFSWKKMAKSAVVRVVGEGGDLRKTLKVENNL